MNRIQLLWERMANRLDAMSLRERAMVFAAAVGMVLFLAYQFAIDPMLRKQKLLLEQIHQQNSQMSGIDMEIQAKVQAFASDPDAPVRAQLSDVRHQIDKSTQALMSVQKGLVAPDKIAPLLEKILHGNGRLKLISLRTLPVAGMSEAINFNSKAPEVPAAQSAGAQSAASMVTTAVQTAQAGTAAPSAPGATPAAPKPRELLYRHGVEIVLQGSYLDMVSYMDALESLPAQLFWGKAELAAGQYPNARLKLTLYTLSLDQKWMEI
jgi:MSHA biogenesis protein MshJ